MTSRDPRRPPMPASNTIDRLPVRTLADLTGAIVALAEALGQAATMGDIAPGLVTRAEGQVAKAREQAQARPVDKTMLLIHLVAARAFLDEGQAPPALTGAVDGVIARGCMRSPARRPRRFASAVLQPFGSTSDAQPQSA